MGSLDEESGREGASRRLDRVVRVLLERISDGTFPPGALLPPQRELTAELGVSRDTVQRALRQLADEGYVQSRQGSGTRVVRLPQGDERLVRPSRVGATLRALVQKAFESRAVTIDAFSLTGETLNPHLLVSFERIRAGEIRPESISVRLLQARVGSDLRLLTAVGEPEDRRALGRLRQVAAMTMTSIRSSLHELQRDGLVPSVRFETAETSVAPMQKLYLLNTTDALTGYYEVVRRRVLLDSSDEIEVHDILGLGAPLHHHSVAGERPDPGSVAIVDSAKRWYEHAWANAEPSRTG